MMRMLVIILCLIGAFFAWNFIDDRMKRNKLEHAVSLAQHDPKRAVEFLIAYRGDRISGQPKESIAENHEAVNRLFPQNADWQDWAYLEEFYIRLLNDRRLWAIFYEDMESEKAWLYGALSSYARSERIAKEERKRERSERIARETAEIRAAKKRARLREERQNRWVIVQLAGRPELRFDISNDKGRASLIRWYNSTFYPEPHETRSRAVRRTRSGRQVGVQVEKLPGFVPIAKFVGTAIMGGAIYDLAKESGALDSAKKAGKWAWKKAIISKPWAAQELDLQEKEEIHRDLFKRRLLHIPGTDQPLTWKQQNLLVNYEQKKNLRERTRRLREKEEEDAAWKEFMEAVPEEPEDVGGSEPVSRDREFYDLGWRDRDSPEWPPLKMIKGPQTRHPQGDDGPQTGHPEYE